jgi:hypothetical protein
MSAARARNQLNEESDRLQTQIQQLEGEMLRLRGELDRAKRSKQRVNAERHRRNAPPIDFSKMYPSVPGMNFGPPLPRSVPTVARSVGPESSGPRPLATGSFGSGPFAIGSSGLLGPSFGFGSGFGRKKPAQAAPTPERPITVQSYKTPKKKKDFASVGVPLPKEYTTPPQVVQEGEDKVTYLHHEEIHEGDRKRIYFDFKQRYKDLDTQSDEIYDKFDGNRSRFLPNQKKIIDFFSILNKIKNSFLISLNKVTKNSDLRRLNQIYTEYLKKYQENLSKLNSFLEGETNLPTNLFNDVPLGSIVSNFNYMQRSPDEEMVNRLKGSFETPQVKREKRGANINSSTLRGSKSGKARRPFNFEQVPNSPALSPPVLANVPSLPPPVVANVPALPPPVLANSPNVAREVNVPTQLATQRGQGKSKKGKKRSSKRA